MPDVRYCTDAATAAAYGRSMHAVRFRHLLEPAAATLSLPSGARANPERWSTASFQAPADTSPLELFDLGEHLQQCQGSRGPMFSALCVTDAVDRFLAPRFMTTIVAISLLAVLLALL